MRRPGSRHVIIGAAVAVFLVTGVLPLVYMLATSIGDVPVRVLLLDARQRQLLANSSLLATAAALLAAAIGVPLGFGLARLSVPGTSLLRIVLAAPVLLPPYIVALAWVYVGGSAGIVAEIIGRDVLSAWTYSLPAAAVVLALVYYPVVMLAIEAALRQLDAHLEEAGLIAARAGRVLWRITVPLVAPATGASVLIVFVLAMSEFGVPALLRVRVYPTEVFTAFAALFDFSRATALTIPLLVLTAAIGAIAAVLVGGGVVAGQHRAGATPISATSCRVPIGVTACAAVALAVVLPIAILVREADDVFTVARGSWPSIRASLLLAAVGATLVVIVGGILGYARARSSIRVGHAADVLWVVLFAVPSTVLGVALIALWNRPGPLGVVYGTAAMLVLVYLARLVPVAALIVSASARQVPASQEEAAAVAGASWVRSIGAIVVPQVTRGLAAAWVVAFVFAFGELGASILVSPPGESTLPIRIYTVIANTPASVVAALALLQVAVIFTPLAAGALYVARRGA